MNVRLTLLMVCVMSMIRPEATPGVEMEGMANPEAIVIAGKARFTMLTPSVLRMEWSPTGEFEDRPSQVIINRRQPVPEFRAVVKDDWQVIRTDALLLRYQIGSGPFNEDNTQITYLVDGERQMWRPSDKKTGNLLGTTRTLDGVSGSCPLEEGLVSRDGWHVLDDSSSLVFDERDGRRWITNRRPEKALDWYFFAHGRDFKSLLRDYTDIAGRIPLPPRYVFGAWWSRYWAYTDAELRELVGEFDAHDVPLDVLVVDMDWHKDGWTGYTWNKDYFPDPKGFLRWCSDQDLKTTLNLHPADGVGEHEAAFANVARAMGKDPEDVSRIPFDCADPTYVDAYFKYLHHPLERDGVDFWWIDWQQGEDTTIAGLDPLWWLNHLHWEDMEHNPDREDLRPLIFSRWGGLGNHRYQIGFSGDTFCNWSSLAFQPYFTATAGNVGFAYWSHDIGGHQPGPVDGELYTRWIQYGVFSPVLRTHTTKNPLAERRIWKFDPPAFEASRKAFHMRYELIPYIYTAARQCYDTGLPICRPLYYQWPYDDRAYAHPGEYQFGDDLLVAPVTQPANPITGYAEVEVWLPPGAWVNWFTGRRYDGGKTVLLQVPLDELPLFVRAGAIIPAMPYARRSDAKTLDPLVLHVFPSRGGDTLVYEDDGVSRGYQEKAYAETIVSHSRTDEWQDIRIGPVRGGFPEMNAKRGYEIRVRDAFPKPSGDEFVTLDGVPLPRASRPGEQGWWIDADQVSLVVRLPERAVTDRLVVRVHGSEPDKGGREGLQGRLRALDDVVAILADHLDTVAAEVAAIRHELARSGDIEASWLAARQATRLIGEKVQASPLPADVRRSAILRLLELSLPMKLSAQAGRVSMEVRFQAASAAGEDGAACSGELIMDSPVTGIQSRASAPSGGESGQVSSVWALDGAPQTTALRGKLKLQCGAHELTVPIDQVLLPSINRWWIVGPFDAPEQDRLQTMFEPERALDLKASYEGPEGSKIGWKRVERSVDESTDLSGEFHVEFHKVFDRLYYNAVAYAVTYLEAPDAMDAVLAIGSDDGVVVWLNGKEIYRHDIGRPYQSREDRVPLRLAKGRNALMIKISQGSGMWGFSAHVEDAKGRPLPEVQVGL